MLKVTANSSFYSSCYIYDIAVSVSCLFGVNPLTRNVPYHIEINQVIYITNQLTGFYMTVVNGLSHIIPLWFCDKSLLHQTN